MKILPDCIQADDYTIAAPHITQPYSTSLNPTKWEEEEAAVTRPTNRSNLKSNEGRFARGRERRKKLSMRLWLRKEMLGWNFIEWERMRWNGGIRGGGVCINGWRKNSCGRRSCKGGRGGMEWEVTIYLWGIITNEWERDGVNLRFGSGVKAQWERKLFSLV